MLLSAERKESKFSSYFPGERLSGGCKNVKITLLTYYMRFILPVGIFTDYLWLLPTMVNFDPGVLASTALLIHECFYFHIGSIPKHQNLFSQPNRKANLRFV